MYFRIEMEMYAWLNGKKLNASVVSLYESSRIDTNYVNKISTE